MASPFVTIFRNRQEILEFGASLASEWHARPLRFRIIEPGVFAQRAAKIMTMPTTAGPRQNGGAILY
jgi:hypothetical protein